MIAHDLLASGLLFAVDFLAQRGYRFGEHGDGRLHRRAAQCVLLVDVLAGGRRLAVVDPVDQPLIGIRRAGEVLRARKRSWTIMVVAGESG